MVRYDVAGERLFSDLIARRHAYGEKGWWGGEGSKENDSCRVWEAPSEGRMRSSNNL
jgi:phage gp46-like protein